MAVFNVPGRPAPKATAALLLAALTAGCASAPLRLPSGPETPFAGHEAASDEAFARCRAVRTWSAELSVSGRVGGDRVRGRILAGFERGGLMRLEGLAPFGAPIFVLAARDGNATLLLTRDRRVLERAEPASVLEALTGVALTPDDLMGALTGCVASNTTPRDAVAYQGGWVAVNLAGSATAYLRRDGTRWRATAGRRGPVTVGYLEWSGDRPSRLRLRVMGATGALVADLSMSIESPAINAAIPPAAFEIRVPPGTAPITLDEVRRAGPLAGTASR